ncbi:hypothetical protein JX265_000778 [Neoarthrinium moseri]|uniref:Uncharacterized protein n=1 Tax=Neoarthrinium moseri TaxID=1658444 RepID=A0A9P9WWT5_9PEZI|nr:hypothetical protein JX265_000778 [Neoarthrinium moseri]
MSAQLESQASFESGISGFMYRQFLIHRKPVPPGMSMKGKTAIVTGSNTGLGLEAARQLLQLGATTLVMAVRSLDKGNEAAKELRPAFPQARVEVWALDMEDYAAIETFAEKCKDLKRIDVVILNAGLQNTTYKRSVNTGHEQVLQVNYLSTALLTILLLPVLRAKKESSSRSPVITLVTSDTAYWATLNAEEPVLAQFDNEERFSQFAAYTGTKLLEQMFLIKLAELVSADDVIINAVNPGLVDGTALDRDSPAGLLFGAFRRIVGRSLEVGGSTFPSILYTEGGHTVMDRLWEETIEELDFAGVSKILQEMQT